MMSLKTATPVGAETDLPSGKPVRKVRRDNDGVVKLILTALALVSVAVVFFIIAFILYNSWDAISQVGIVDFVFGTVWSPSTERYGAAAIILGTILVTAGSMAVCIPLGISAAIFLSEIASERTRNILKPVCEIFAGIPSVIFGFIGMTVLVPLIMELFPDNASGSCWLAASLLLGIMALPTVMSVSDDALKAVPMSYREASLAMGATKWETIRSVVLPAAISGVSAAVILGIGRALGETMAVIMVAGNGAVIPEPFYNIFSIIRTMTASIALEMPDVVIGSVHYSALFFLALILMIFVVAINLLARSVINANRRKMGLDGGRRSRLAGLVPESVGGFVTANKAVLTRIAATAIMVVLVTMILSLFVGGVKAFVVSAAIAVAYIVAGRLVSRRSNPMIVQKAMFAAMTAVVAVILLILGYIIFDIVSNGLPALSIDFLTEAPSRGGKAGGIAPALIGTIELIAGTAAIALPLGIVAGVWLAMYASDGKVPSLVRNAIDALNGTPSIVFGLFGMAVFVVAAGWGYSLIGGCITLAFMILPVIIRTTEEAVRAVPRDLLEASMAMGASKWQSIVKVILPASMGGIMTGSILGLGRAAGETAPIMLTATVAISTTVGVSGLFEPVMALPYHLYYLAMEVPNSTEAQYGTALVLLILVLVMFGLASLIRYRYSKNLRW